jgi:hypothetical protein
MIDMASIVLQELMDFEKIRGPHIAICPAPRQDALQAISIKQEEVSGAEEKDDPDETLLRMLKPEVSCLYIHLRQIPQTQTFLIL